MSRTPVNLYKTYRIYQNLRLAYVEGVHDGALRKPCLIRYPGEVPKGRSSNDIVHITDSFSTVLRLAGCEILKLSNTMGSQTSRTRYLPDTLKRDEPIILRKLQISRYLPIVDTLRNYQLGWLRPDIIAGVTVWAIMVPQNMAYATIAGVSPEAGLYTGLFALIFYGIFASSRHLVVGPSTTVSIISVSFIAALAVGGSGEYIALTAGLAFLVGILCILAGVARLGFITNFFAKPVLDGFILGLALIIALGQLDKMLGIKATGDNFFFELWDLVIQLPNLHLITLALGVGSYALMVAVRKFVPRLPAALVALVVGIGLVTIFDLDSVGVSIVGDIPAGLPPIGLPAIGLGDISALIPAALAVVIVGYAESIAAARNYASKHGYEVDANQEFIGLGTANLAAGLSQGFVVDGSLSKTASADDAGQKTQVAALIDAGLLLLTILFLTPLFHDLANATLGAIVVFSVSSLINFSKLKRLYRVDKADLTFFLVAVLGVLIFGVAMGLLLAVAISLTALIYRATHPGSEVLGRSPVENVYQDIERYPENETFPGLLIFRFDAELFFANSAHFRTRILDLMAAADPPLQAIVIDAEAIQRLDTTAAEMLEDLVSELKAANIELLLARTHGPVRDMVDRIGLLESIGADHMFPSVRAAVDYYLNHYNLPAPSDPSMTSES